VPLSPDAMKAVPKAPKPPSAGGANDSPSQAKAPDSSGAKKSSKATSGSTPSKSRKKKMAPPSLWLHGLGTAGGTPSPSDSTLPSAESLPRVFSRVTDSLTKDLNFIKVEFHIRRFVTAAVNTEAGQSDIQVLQASLDSTSIQINVSIPLLFSPYHSFLILALFHPENY
jgi:hypothetical protein